MGLYLLDIKEYIEILENDLKEVNLRLESHNYYKENLEEIYRTNSKILLKNNLKETLDIVIIIFTFYVSRIIGNNLKGLNKSSVMDLKDIILHLLNLISRTIPYISLLDFSCNLVVKHESLTEYKGLIKDTKKNLIKLKDSINELNMTKYEILELIKKYNQIANCIEIQLDVLNDKTNFNPIFKFSQNQDEYEVKVLKLSQK